MTYKDFLWYLFTTIASLLILAYLFSTPISNAYAPTVEKKITWRDTLNNYPDLLRVATCESNLNPKAYNKKDSDGEPKYSVLQFDADTFIDWTQQINKEKGYKKWDIWDPEDQVIVGIWAFSKGYQDHWGCK